MNDFAHQLFVLFSANYARDTGFINMVSCTVASSTWSRAQCTAHTDHRDPHADERDDSMPPAVVAGVLCNGIEMAS
jgi:hypothetical protein